MQRIAVTGAGGFIGTHLIRRLRADGHWVRGVDIKDLEAWGTLEADENLSLDLRDYASALVATAGADEVYALAADMGGMGFISKEHARIIRNNTMINVNSIEAARRNGVGRYLFASSACVYNQDMQTDTASWALAERDAYPAWPDTAYGWEKLHGEHLCRYYREAGWLDTRIARIHNAYGPECAWCGDWDEEKQDWEGGREKAPAALCRKVAVALLKNGPVEIWGDGQQVRSYMYVEDCVDGLVRLMRSDYPGPLNLGSNFALTVDELADSIAAIAGIKIVKKHVPGPEGVRIRNSDNHLCKEVLGWVPSTSLWQGLTVAYQWIEKQVLCRLM